MSDIDYNEVQDYASESAGDHTPEAQAAAAAHAKAMGEYEDAEVYATGNDRDWNDDGDVPDSEVRIYTALYDQAFGSWRPYNTHTGAFRGCAATERGARHLAAGFNKEAKESGRAAEARGLYR